jgi:PAS domain S-box-containing protein
MSDDAVKVLLVEDSISDARLIQLELHTVEETRFEITWVERLDEALALVAIRSFDVCLLDLSLPDSSGMATFSQIRHCAPSLPVVVLTGLEDDAAGLSAIRQGVQDYLTKRTDNGRAVARSIRYAIERKRSAEALEQLNADLERRVAEQTAQIRRANENLEKRIAERTAELESVNKALRESRQAALNLAEDAVTSRKEAEKVSEDLFRSREEWVETFNVIPDQITILDNNHRIVRANKALADALGVSVPEVMGQPCFRCVHDSQTPISSCPHMQMVKNGKQQITEIHENRLNKDFLVSVTPIFDKTGRIKGAVHVARDITEHKKRENELAAANRELDAFSYSVSHDLRAPLHVISGFAALLLKEYKDILDERGRDFVKTLLSEVDRINKLIADMLYLSRITRQEMRRTEIDLSGSVEKILKDLLETWPHRRVEAIVSKGLRCMADERLVYILLQNLVDNAWKFSKNKAKARIEFGETIERGLRSYFVRDNGAGFSMENAERLFKPFQRLHAQDQFEGTGIGLAIVKRIVSRHGGTIWAMAEKGLGTTFFFTLE